MSQKNPKKIALVMRDFSSQVGGAERFSVNLAKGLIENGLEVELWGKSLESGLNLENHFRKISYTKKPSSAKVWSFCSGYKRMLKQNSSVLTFGITQVYPVDVYRVGSGIYPNWLRIQNPNILFRLMHVLIRPVYWANRMIEKKIMTSNRLKKVVVNSKLEKANLLRYYPIAEEKIDVIYNGVDLGHFHPRWKKSREEIRKELKTEPNAFVLLFPSNNFKRKGLDTLIRTVAFMKQKNLIIWVAGKGKEASFRTLSKEIRVKDQVQFLGRRSDMEKLYGAADCMVLPTQYDSFSNVVLEAMACDLPVITTGNNGAAEAIQQGKNGYVMEDHSNAPALARSIEDVMQKSDEWEGNARRRAEDFPLIKCTAAYVKLLQDLI